MFRLRELWQSNKPPSDEFSPDAITSLVVNDSNCIVTGSFSGYLRFYYPQKADSGLPFTEIKLKEPILQLKYGVFLKEGQEALAVLHPNLLVLYEIKLQDKTIVASEIQSFLLSHSSYNFISCQIDSLNSPPSIVVQSLDGQLSVINGQSVTAYQIPHFFLPCPFTYIPLLESFIFATSDYKVICYRKNVIFAKHSGEASEEWSYIFGEAVVSINSWKTSAKHAGSSNFDIAIIGERTIAVLTDSGKLKTLMKHNGNCLCAHSYVSTPDNSKVCNNLIVGCQDKTLSIFINFKKVWQLTLSFIPISIFVVDIPPNKGLIAAMDANGTITVGYLGTHETSSLGLPNLPEISKEQLKEHLSRVNKRIGQIPTADHLQLFVKVSRASPALVELVFQPNNKGTIKDVSCYADLPLSIERVPPIKVGTLTDKEETYHLTLVPTQCPPVSLSVYLNATFTTVEDRVLSKSVKFDVPFEFFVKRVEGRVKGAFALIIYSKGDFQTLAKVFPNTVFPEKHSFSFVLANGEVISISEDSKNKRYRLEADSFDRIGFAINILYKGLLQSPPVQNTSNSNSSQMYLYIKDQIPIDKFNDIIREHYNLRVKERDLKKKIHSSVQELEHIQKALIARYEAATPEPLDDLNTLLNNCTTTLKDLSKQVQSVQQDLKLYDGRIEAGIHTLLFMLQFAFDLDKKKVDLLQTCLPARVQDCTPGWEECAYASLNYLNEKISGTKQNAAFGGEVEFLNNIDIVTDLFKQLIVNLSKSK